MLVSVIVPVYNVERYLRECLESILAQTYNELEVILVDDGSTDGSGKICDEYAEKYDHFSVIYKKNEGLGMARNTGLEHMRGDYVTFVDSDDYIEPTCIQTLMENLIKHQVDMCKGGSRRITNDKKILSEDAYIDEVYKDRNARELLLPRMIGSSPDKKDSIGKSVCGVVFSCNPIRKYKLRFFSEREMIEEDLVFHIDYMQHAKGACLIKEVVYNYRYNTNSLTTSYRKDRFEANCRFYLAMLKKLTQLQYDEMTVMRLKRNFFVSLRGTIFQETKKISGKSFTARIQRIREICSDRVVREAIETYPIERLDIFQKFFLYLIRRRAAVILYFAVGLKNNLSKK